jgi:membrane-associated phospholipid phosphatase
MSGSQSQSQSESESQSQSESEGFGLALGNIALSNVPTLRRPLGVTPSGKESNLGTFVGQSWPPASKASAWPNANWPNKPHQPKPAPYTFERLFAPGSPWTAEFYPVALLAEFVTIGGGAWKDISLPREDIEADLKSELEQLVKIMDYRPGMVSEFLAQCNGILDYLRGIFSFSAKSHPMTYALGATAIYIGEFQVMYYKAKYNRPRPSRLSPRLMPLIEVPGHASFPSGHATQSRLAAKLLAEVMPEEAKAPLCSLANRIARNREVMGLHYPSDSRAGRHLADETLKLLKRSETVKKMIVDAREEWHPPAKVNKRGQ